MTLTSETLYEGLVKYLRDNFPDPLGKGRVWIYPGEPRQDATMPRVWIEETGLWRTEIGLGDRGSRINTYFEIGIITNSRTTVTVNGDVKKGSELREWIASKIVKLIVDGRDYLRKTLGIIDIFLVGSRTYPYNEPIDLYRKDLFIRVEWEIPKT